ncbi:hypothetical protein E5676_scaffold952G00180 [Cucumis melo var. makuwa]|uniref:Uncharacterized protein n=1 Tax=Cucumis melo var. makuwa TaxID=1194695 RepID=A0A5A7U8X6_CUCMM|nr:hypothetical protein E6C27_scaffold60G001280 [Cucumis melo var. makuwa]TYK11557.1 hypothetical protein E5676_scaffold952G00180 [Cucumis melo var. makuwa]
MCHKDRHFKNKCTLNKSKEASSNKHAAETSVANVTNGYDLVEKKDERKVLLGDNGTSDVKGTRLGCAYKSDNGVLRVTKGSLVKLKGTLRNGVYVLECTTVLVVLLLHHNSRKSRQLIML